MQDTGLQPGGGLVLPDFLLSKEDSDDAGGEAVSELTGASVCDCSRGRQIEDLLGDCTLKYIQFT